MPRPAGRGTIISIHVLRVEDDNRKERPEECDHDFNPRPPCGGRPNLRTTRDMSPEISIHVLRVEDDLQLFLFTGILVYFNPRPPCGGRRLTPRPAGRGTIISIHVLRVEDDIDSRSTAQYPGISIHVLRVEDDGCGHGQPHLWHISIHVLRVEDDSMYGCPVSDRNDFNPRPPCGGRHGGWPSFHANRRFQSTSSVWRTTYIAGQESMSDSISIHVLRVEDDCIGRCISAVPHLFQSTSSVWRTTSIWWTLV